MASLFGQEIEFLNSAYRPRAQQPDTGGQSFMRAFERAQDMKLKERELALQEQQAKMQMTEAIVRQKVADQTFKINALKIEDAIRLRDDEIAAQGALSTFGERIRRAKIIGPNEPTAQAGVIEWADKYRGLLTMPAGKALWDDYLQSIEDDRKHAMQLDTLKQTYEERLTLGVETAQARSAQTIALEAIRQANRIQLEELRSKLSNELKVGATRVTRPQFITRELRTYAGDSVLGETETDKQKRFETAATELGNLYDQVVNQKQSLPPLTIATPAVSQETSASPYSTKEDVVNAFKAGQIDRAEASRILNEKFGIPLN